MKSLSAVTLACLACVVFGATIGWRARAHKDGIEFNRVFDQYQDSVHARNAIFHLGTLQQLRGGNTDEAIQRLEGALGGCLAALSRYADVRGSDREQPILRVLNRVLDYYTDHTNAQVNARVLDRARKAATPPNRQ